MTQDFFNAMLIRVPTSSSEDIQQIGARGPRSPLIERSKASRVVSSVSELSHLSETTSLCASSINPYQYEAKQDLVIWLYRSYTQRSWHVLGLLRRSPGDARCQQTVSLIHQ